MNLAVEHGIMNGTQGHIVDFIYRPGHNPNHDDYRCRMPHIIIIDVPKYKGPPFWNDTEFPERRTWIPLQPIVLQCILTKHYINDGSSWKGIANWPEHGSICQA